MSLAKPTIVLVGGAWHEPHLYSPLSSALESAGYTVSTPALPSVGGLQEDISEDVSAVREAIISTADAGNDVVVLMHSYGGVVGSEAAKGLTRLDRGSEAREKGSVVRMIYLCAFAIPEKGSLMAALDGKPLPWWEATEDGKAYNAINTHEIFYNDIDKAKADELTAQLKHHAKGPFSSKVTYAAWKHIQSTYIICEKDNAIPVEAQEEMTKQGGNKFTVVRLDASHSPFLSKLDETVTLIRKAIGESV